MKYKNNKFDILFDKLYLSTLTIILVESDTKQNIIIISSLIRIINTIKWIQHLTKLRE